jgi:hypothetical protein
MRSFSVIAAAALGLASAQDFKIIIESKSTQPLGMYWIGSAEGLEGAVVPKGGTENFIETIGSHQKIAHAANFGDRFVFRTTEFGGFRCAVQVQRGVEKNVNGANVDFPYSLTMQAIGAEKHAGHLELKHGGGIDGSKPEFLWINRGQQVQHLTENKQEFTLRNTDRKDMISFTLADYNNEL